MIVVELLLKDYLVVTGSISKPFKNMFNQMSLHMEFGKVIWPLKRAKERLCWQRAVKFLKEIKELP